ncbi:MAG: hypothetical protein ABR616_09850 [Dermatophilaceae bacterium]
MDDSEAFEVSWRAIGRFQRRVAVGVFALAVFVGVGDSLEGGLVAVAFGVGFMVLATVTLVVTPRFSPGVMTVGWASVRRRFSADRYAKAVVSQSYPQLLLVDARERIVKTGVHRRMFADPDAVDAAFVRWAQQSGLEIVREK